MHTPCVLMRNPTKYLLWDFDGALAHRPGQWTDAVLTPQSARDCLRPRPALRAADAQSQNAGHGQGAEAVGPWKTV